MRKTYVPLFLLTVGLLGFYFSFAFNGLYLWDTQWLRNFQGDSQQMVVDRMFMTSKRGFASYGGFLMRGDQPYLSQAGLQGTFFDVASMALSSSMTREKRLLLFQHATALACAAVLILFIAKMWKEFGTIAAITGYLVILYSPWLTYFAHNLYWVIALQFTPFVFSWLFFEKLYLQKGRPTFFLIIFILVLLKSLSGYEYVTNVISSAAVPAIYFTLREKKIRTMFLSIFQILCCGIAGFFAAIFIHLIQAYFYFGNLSEEVHHLFFKSRVMTLFSKGLNDPLSREKVTDVVQRFLELDALSFSFFSSGKTLWSVSFSTLVYSVLLLIGLMVIKKGWHHPLKTALHPQQYDKLDALAIATFAAMISSLSWAVMAKGHMYFHLHMNAIVFYIPFVVVYGVFMGYLFRCWVPWLWQKRILQHFYLKVRHTLLRHPHFTT